jgi:large subunit ribosomal protein L21
MFLGNRCFALDSAWVDPYHTPFYFRAFEPLGTEDVVMKFAVVRTGGKQYKVSEGQILRVEKLEGEVGATVALSDVLLVAREAGDVSIGRPQVVGASVQAQIVQQGRGRKTSLFKYKPGARGVKRGHRQAYTQLKITHIEG